MAICPFILIFLHISSKKWFVFAIYFGLPNFLPQLANFFTRIYLSYPGHFAALNKLLGFKWMRLKNLGQVNTLYVSLFVFIFVPGFQNLYNKPNVFQTQCKPILIG